MAYTHYYGSSFFCISDHPEEPFDDEGVCTRLLGIIYPKYADLDDDDDYQSEGFNPDAAAELTYADLPSLRFIMDYVMKGHVTLAGYAKLTAIWDAVACECKTVNTCMHI